MTKARTIADLGTGFVNITDTGTEGTKVASGTTAQRGSTTGQIRFNTTTGLAEYYTGTVFKAIDTPPIITSIDVTNIATDLGGTQTFVISGSLFNNSATVKFRDNGGTLITPDTTTVNSSTQITVTKTRSSFSNANEPYDVIVTNPSNLEATLDNQINVDNSPVWSTASGSLATIYDSSRSGISISVTATDSDGDTVTYSVQSGTLPTGLSLNSSTGAITGTASAVGSDTTSSFTLRATANSETADRAFSITVKAPVTQTFSYTGSNQTFSVPTGLTSITAYMWGAGGGGGNAGGWQAGFPGGGGGSAVGTIDVSGITSLIMIVGQGGAGQDSDQNTTVRDAFGGGGGNNTTSDNRYTGGGGGLSGIFNGSYTHANSLLIAGGGGGGGARNTNSTNNNGGAGGGTDGQDGFCTYDTAARGGGGSQTGGGSNAGNTNSASEGSALQGGKNPSTNYGGGGGGGYYGGGCGSYIGGATDMMGGGGGGSGYKHPTLVSNGTLYQGSGQTVANSSASQRGGLGDGGAIATDGDHGVIVINY